MFSLPGRLILGFLLGISCAPCCTGYSVLTHEAIVDAAWKDGIAPLLLNRFPHASPEELLQAHAYAYGGAIIQDLGYYPFGSHFFSDLTHYVRSGDFVLALIEQSRDLNEYAFALGALSHYAADTSGHELATNRAVAIMYPGLAKKYGPIVTYQEKPSAHMKVEYGFDVDQVAEGNYAPKAYHDFVGFEVSKPVLERAFARTYSLDMSSVFFSVDLSIGSYRHAVSTVIPRMTKVAWHLKRDEIQNSHPGETKKEFIYNISNSGYRKDWGQVYEKPGFFARLKAFCLRVVPKVGPFGGLAFHPPTAAIEQLYMNSFNETLDHYRALLLAQQEHRLQLPNDNLDTGAVTGAAAYRLTDDTYAKLLDRTSGKPVSEALRRDLLSYYTDLEKPFATKRSSKAWHELIKELDILKSTTVVGRSLSTEPSPLSACFIQELWSEPIKTASCDPASSDCC
ncbi:MAG TPA: zinc dependent phospholipase C family protein [Candidatus Polarisedimenticolia bacterium]|nr:zinc dependent phospholipase C family protein [Candidatus Polarisedimenticolia bacterium]